MSGAIAIFVKTPGLSPIKTRLAVSLGKQAAESFHLASASAVAEVVQAACKEEKIQGYFAVAEQAALSHDYWQGLPCVWQGEGGLGERMAHIYQTLLAQHDFVILVGADIPQMTVTNLSDAAACLSHSEQARLVFGPSDDGGFWSVGGNCSILQAVWTDVIYSLEDTGAQFLNRIEQVGDVKILTSLRDVDELKDLVPLRKTLVELKQPVQAQQVLIHFLDTVLPVTVNK